MSSIVWGKELIRLLDVSDRPGDSSTTLVANKSVTKRSPAASTDTPCGRKNWVLTVLTVLSGSTSLMAAW